MKSDYTFLKRSLLVMPLFIFIMMVDFSETFSSKLELVSVKNGFKILVYDETSGYTHVSRDAARVMFEKLGETMGFEVDFDRDGNAFNTLENLQNYAVVVFSNTSGDEILNQVQKENFEAYIKAGGSFLGIHAATDTYRTGWDWYRDLVGGSVRTDPNHTAQDFPGTMDVLDADHPSTKEVPNPWSRNEEWYYWRGGGGYLFEGNINLLQVRATGDEPYDEARPISWYKNFDGGKSFYTAMGHANSTYSEQAFISHITGAIEWLTADLETPVAVPPSFDAISDPAPITANADAQTVNITDIDAGSGKAENITITASSSNSALIPDPDINYTAGENSATLTYQPLPDMYGSAVITVTVHNGEEEENEAVRTFTVVVVSGEAILEVTDIPDQTIVVGEDLAPMEFTVFHQNQDYDKIVVSVASDNPELIPDDQITVEGEGENYSISFNPNEGSTGSAIITLTVSDGENEVEKTFTLQILSVTSVDNDITLKSIEVFPNPAIDYIKVKMEGGFYKLTLQDETGAIVMSSEVAPVNSEQNMIPLYGLSAGVYILKLTSDNHSVSRKLIVK